MPISKKEQVRTGYILDDVLRPMLPGDAAALIAFTNEDLFPDSSMNYVFGQASLGKSGRSLVPLSLETTEMMCGHFSFVR